MTFENNPIAPEELPEIQDAVFHDHPVRFRKKKLIIRLIVFVILLAGPVALIFTGNMLVVILSFVAWTLLFSFSVLIVFKEFPKRAYALREKDITYRKGWIFHSVTSVPFNRIQHSEIDQGPLDRAFSLASLNLYTAGGSGSDLTIPGLPYEEAVRLREYVARKTAADE
ncbi:PH domain-containing protein [Fulvivirga sedimenti]|jgi:membrane protein YdbS with pleckstrin-like domain|uniref:PH domain-containing protein n=1 Tax=Fulvivirga sedimenti TaxID=2879465 RepID=A0A9X1KUX9_9BACT|nr:PH domain-containing protein [Fulvivirga sedimenti]MCA6074058.1 PH domain-containing protein [Fulvivirga sedimenti]